MYLCFLHICEYFRVLRLQAGHKYCLLGRLSSEVGWNHYDTIKVQSLWMITECWFLFIISLFQVYQIISFCHMFLHCVCEDHFSLLCILISGLLLYHRSLKGRGRRGLKPCTRRRSSWISWGSKPRRLQTRSSVPSCK